MTVTDFANADDLTTNLLGGRYVLGEIVGQGGMSTVYKAVDLTTSTAVAVKIFHPGIELADSLPRRRREVQLAAGLHHPAIVEVLDADVEVSNWASRRAYIVTELVNGPTLAQRLRLHSLSAPQVARMGVLLCDALAYMHQQRIVHRDLKPANILLSIQTVDGALYPKLADFGLAYMLDSTRMTGVGLTAGTPNYLSPEQVRGKPTTPASDIYALGLVLIEALTGRPAFAGHGIEAALARLSNDPPLPSNLDPRMADLLMTMTAADPARRPSAGDVAARLSVLSHTSLASDVLAIAPEPTPLVSTGPVPRSRPCQLGMAAVAALSLLCACVVGAVVVALAGFAGGSNRTQLPTGDIAATVSGTTVSQGTTSQAGGVEASSTTTLTTPVAAADGPAVSPPRSTGPVQVARSASQVQGNVHGRKNGNNKGRNP
jgi:serine/threonine protein kinase